MKKWRCKTCGKEATESGPKDEAAPEHVAYRGYDIGNCPGVMERIDDEPEPTA